MATARSAWSASIERANHGGVYLFESHEGRVICQVWFPGAAAAMGSAQGRQFRWRDCRAIGSTVLLRGDLIQWGGNE
jgi:hypothetical protein